MKMITEQEKKLNNELTVTAIAEYAVHEMTGAAFTERIHQYAVETGLDKVYSSDEIAWCALFVSWVCWKCDANAPKSLAAISFLEFGSHLTIEEAVVGDLIILYRGDVNSWQSHVGFFVAFREGQIYMLAGNQRNQVNIMSFPVTKLRGVRRLSPLNTAI